MREYTGMSRRTKDLDIFVRPSQSAPVLDVFADAGFVTELTDHVWLGKTFCDEHFIDIIWSSGNGIATVDDAWFEHAVRAHLFGHDVMLVPPEEVIWSKAYVMERDRFDGADIAHLILKCGGTLDYERLLARMDAHWEILLVHLLLFRFVYPNEHEKVPEWLTRELERRYAKKGASLPGDERISRGPLLSKKEYVADFETFGYHMPIGETVDIGLLPPKAS
jgi:hypothetical protein